VIAGAQDPATPPNDAEYLVSQIVDSRLVTLDAAHLSNVEQTEGFNMAMLDFAASVLSD
jgi:3-oxoadipate enol-lactonase